MERKEKIKILKQYLPISRYLKYVKGVIVDYYEHNLMIEKSIEKVEDPTLKNILILHYIDGKTFEEIGEIMKYCERQVIRLHKKAIDAINLKGRRY